MTQTHVLQPGEILELGIFAKTFQRGSIDGVFEAIARHGLGCTQWNWSCVPGLTSLPLCSACLVAFSISLAAFTTNPNLLLVFSDDGGGTERQNPLWSQKPAETEAREPETSSRQAKQSPSE
jgi:hypothetical protein